MTTAGQPAFWGKNLVVSIIRFRVQANVSIFFGAVIEAKKLECFSLESFFRATLVFASEDEAYPNGVTFW